MKIIIVLRKSAFGREVIWINIKPNDLFNMLSPDRENKRGAIKIINIYGERVKDPLQILDFLVLVLIAF